MRTVVVRAALAALVAGTAACGSSGGGSADHPTATGRFAFVHTSLCAAAEAAEAGDPSRAAAEFDDAHVGLHDLAAAVEREDRALAARLLEAKQRVEAGGGADAVRALVVVVAEGVEVTGGTAPETCAG